MCARPTSRGAQREHRLRSPPHFCYPQSCVMMHQEPQGFASSCEGWCLPLPQRSSALATSCSPLVSCDRCSPLPSYCPRGGGGLLRALRHHYFLLHPQLPPSPQHQRHIPRATGATLPIKASSLRAPGRALRWYGQCPIALPRNTGVKLEATWGRSQDDDTQGLMGITQMFKRGADSISGSTARTWPEARNVLATALTYQQQTTLQTACKQAPT